LLFGLVIVGVIVLIGRLRGHDGAHSDTTASAGH
jgi:hypothetical protein